MTDRVRRVALNGVSLGCEIRGEDAGAPPLVFAHGYAMRATGALYAELLDRLAARFTVYAVDLRGHGASAEAVVDWSYETIADDLAGLAPALGIARPVFLGHSFGCVVGLYAAMRHPGAFEALCLLEPGPADSRSDPVDTLDTLIAHGHDRDAMRRGFARMFVHDPGAKLEEVVDAAVRVDTCVHRAQKAQNPFFSIDDRLKEVAAPALIVSGRCDGVVDPARQHDMAGKLPRSKEVIFSGEGHMLVVERPGVAAREVLAFLGEAVAPAPS